MAGDERKVTVGWEAEYPHLASRESNRLHVLIHASAPSVKSDRTPVNLCLVLDRSGSMRGNKLRYTLESASILVDHLTEIDRLSVVFYDSDVETVLPPTPVIDRLAIRRVLSGVRAKGTTNLSGGWLQGIRLIEKAHLKGGANRILLMTDGLANRGITDTPSLRELADKSRRKGILTTTLGFGRGFNEDLLTAIASTAGGNFYYIQNPDDAPRAFSSELGELMGLAAQNFQGRIRFADGVSFTGLLNNYPHQSEAGVLEVFAGDVFSAERRTILLGLEVEPGGEGERALFRASFEYDDLTAGGESRAVEMEASLPVRAASLSDSDRLGEIVLGIALFRAGEAKSRARAMADKGDLDGGAKLLEKALRGLADLPDLPEVKQERKDLRLFADEFRKSSWNADERKSLSASIFRSQVGRISLAPGSKKIADTRVEGEKKKKK